MSFEKILFYFFSALIVLSATCVITSRNAVRAVLFLVFAFVNTAALWILLGSEYLALTLIIVYVGAVMVLFLFVVMMLDIKIESFKESFTRYMPLAVLIAAFIVAQLAWVFFDWSSWLTGLQNLPERAADYSSIAVLGQALYDDYLYPVQVAAILLLVAMIAAVGLTFRGIKARKMQNPPQQMQVRKEERVKLIHDL